MPKRKNSRAANGSGTFKHRSDGRWEGQYIAGIDPVTGKYKRKSIYARTKTELRQKMTKIQRELDAGTYTEPSRLTVADWMTEWMTTFCANSVKPLTISSYESIIKNHIAPYIGNVKLQSVRGTHIQKLYNAMIEKGSSPKTVKNVSAVMHKAFSVAVKQGLIVSNPVDAADLPKSKKHEIQPLKDNEIPLFLDAIESDSYRNVYALCLFAGLREGECLGLSWSQVDFENQRITINQQLQKEKKKGGKHYIADTTKSDNARTIEPPAIAFEYLRDEKLKQMQNRLRAGSEWNNEWDLVFTNEFGRHIIASTMYKRFKKIAESIGRPDLRPHDLRHSCATVAVASGADIKSVQSLLGHATASFTLNVYAHTSEQMKKDTASRMQDYYSNLTKKA